MITESKVTEILCIADNFCKEFEVEMAKKALPASQGTPRRRRKRMMSDAEVITILICFHFNTYRNFKHYYLSCVCGQWKHLFPKRFSYNRFVEFMPHCFIALSMSLKLACFGECTGTSFVDSTCIPVIHNKRQFNMKVFKGIAGLWDVVRALSRTRIKKYKTLKYERWFSGYPLFLALPRGIFHAL